ncbi:MAG: DNA polymerase I [Chloroflexi bacterium]|nr:DNA polymerase I [Chloroflexota bacterium]
MPVPRKKDDQGTLLRDRPLLMLMDGNAMVHRAYHAIHAQNPMIARGTGEETSGVYGFTTAFLKAIAEWHPTHCAVAFDLPGPTFRHQQYEAYKAQRPEAAPELRAQFPRVHQIMEAFGVPIFELERYEADDILGCLCRQAEEQHLEAIILTGDADTLQLVSPWVRVVLQYSIQERKVFDEVAVRERYGGLEPNQQPNVKALQGDPSDNIPGVPGVGPKTAVKLIQQFGSVEAVYEHLEEVEPPRLRELLREHREAALRGKQLTTIVKELPIKLDLESLHFGAFDRERVLAVFRELEFSSLVGRIPSPMGLAREALASAQDPQTIVRERGVEHQVPLSISLPRDYRTVDTSLALASLVGELRSAGSLAFDVETTSLDAMQCALVGLSFSSVPGRAYYVPVGHQDGPQLPMGEVLEALKPLLEDPSLGKVAHNANFDMTVLANAGVQVRGLTFDTMVVAQLTDHKAIGLKELAFQLLNEEMTPISALIGTGKKQVSFDQVPMARATPYAAADADMTGRLRIALEPVLRQMGLERLHAEVELPLAPVLVQMQRNGILVDRERLRAMSAALERQLHALEAQIHDLVGKPFNINSTQQLGSILFDELLPPAKLREMGLPAPKRTKTGYSTDAAVLEELKGAHDVVDKVLEYRQFSKLKSTYLDALPTLVNPRTGRVHTSYNQVGSATGRISSSDPNLQNIPIRTDIGRQVRRAFLAQPGWQLLAADYSQVELRILAHMSRDPGLLAAFHRGEDIHAATASQVYGVPLQEVTPNMRRLAKVMNFGVIYGLSAHGIAQQTELSREQGAAFIESYFGKYPGIRAYIEETKRLARERGYVETLLGRRRYIPEIHHSSFQVRQAAERMAINMPVQGTAADIIKIAMARIQQRMEEQRLRSRMLLQVHDELIFEVPPEELEATKAMVLELMPSAMALAVPLKVDVKVGPSWGDLE